MGGSNGGLLVCVAMTQRPELFGAGVALVPLADMLRYHLFRLGAYWTDEYGSPDDPVASRWLRAYSPIHNITSRPYPAVLLWAAESDSRVDPMHARKMAAALSKATTSSRPIVLRVETKAGHGMGKPVGKIADQLAAEIAFLETELSP
jgi:prolyl oligopeptidase